MVPYLNYNNIMTEQVITKLKSKIKSLEEELADKTDALTKYQSLGNAAEQKIQILSKLQNDKIRSLMNSIQVLKKENATLEKQGKEHKRSDLIKQLNKQIEDQDIVIDVLRGELYKRVGGKEKGRAVCDELIVTALTKGPERIRMQSREQLKIDIQKLKNEILRLKAPLKNTETGAKEQQRSVTNRSVLSQQSSFENTNEELFKQLQTLKFDNESLKIEIKSNQRIIDNLTTELKGSSKVQVQLLSAKSELDVVQRKVETLESLLKQTKQQSNTKIIELYEREIKVEELELQSKQYSNKLNVLQQTHNMQVEELKLEKDKLASQIESLMKENERLIIDNTASKKRLEEQKNKINEIRELSQKQKEQLAAKLTRYENEIQRIVKESENKTEKITQLERLMREEKDKFMDDKVLLNQEINRLNDEIKNAIDKKEHDKIIKREEALKDEIARLKEIVENGASGTGGIPNDRFLDMIKIYDNKVKVLEKRLVEQGKMTESDVANDRQWMDKYLKLTRDFQQYKIEMANELKNRVPAKAKKPVEVIEMETSEKDRLLNMSSDLSQLGLKSIDGRILNNYDSSFEYSIHTVDKATKGALKINEEDKALLNMMNSDLWDFINQDKLAHLIDQAASEFNSDYEQYDAQSHFEDFEWDRNFKELEELQSKLKKGPKVNVYKEEAKAIKDLSDSVSHTSAKNKKLDEFDSEIELKLNNIDYHKIQDPSQKPLGLNKEDLAKIENISSQISSSIDRLQVSDAKSGQSGINIMAAKKTPKDRGTRLDIKLKDMDSDYQDINKIRQKMDSMNSDVSSSVNSSMLQSITSDVSIKFKKKK